VIAVDASFALKLVLTEIDSDRTRRQWQQWTNLGEIVVAPPLFRAETASAVRRSVVRGLLSADAGDRAFDALQNLRVSIREPATLYVQAWDLTKRFNRPAVYDSCYLALAEIAGCELWTADQRLANAVGTALPWVRTL